MKSTIVVSILGTQLDYVGKRVDRWARWRPNVSLCSQEEFIVSKLYMMHDTHSSRLANNVAVDITDQLTPNSGAPNIASSTVS